MRGSTIVHSLCGPFSLILGRLDSFQSSQTRHLHRDVLVFLNDLVLNACSSHSVVFYSLCGRVVPLRMSLVVLPSSGTLQLSL